MKHKTLKKQFAINSDQQPIDILIQFMKEMNQWEKQRWEEQEKSKTTRKVMILNLHRELIGMNNIFAKYCTPKKRAKNLVGAYSFPAEYDPDNEVIIETVIESNRRAVIYTKQKLGFQLLIRYVLLRRGGQWLIDNKQWRTDNKQRWNRGIL